MNVGEIIDQFRRQSRDIVEEYQWEDDELMVYLNEAQDEAAKRSFLLKTSDPAFLETPAKATITVAGTAGSITSIIVDGINIISNKIDFTGNPYVTAMLLAQEINEQNYFTAVAVSNVITLTALAGNGSYYNNFYPLITQTEDLATATIFSGGIDGICRTQLLPNKREYKFSQTILKFERIFFSDFTKTPCLRDYRNLDTYELANFAKKGCVSTVIYGMSNDSFLVGATPTKKEALVATVYYKPVHKLVKKSDIPEIPEEFHSKLIDYMLYKAYRKNDAEVDAQELSDKYLKQFEMEFNDGQFTNAAQQKNNLAWFFSDNPTYSNW